MSKVEGRGGAKFEVSFFFKFKNYCFLCVFSLGCILFFQVFFGVFLGVFSQIKKKHLPDYHCPPLREQQSRNQNLYQHGKVR